MTTLEWRHPNLTPTPTPAPLPELTAREQRVLVGMANGLTNAQIAVTVRATPDSVKGNVVAVIRHMRARNRAHAVARAFGYGLITPADVPAPDTTRTNG